MSTRDLTKMALLLALLCISAYIAVPLPISPVPVTATVFILVLIALLLKPKHTFFVLIAYLIIGAIGVPVFANGKSGLGVILGPTGGYLIGYLVAYTVFSFLKGPRPDVWRYIVIGVFIGIPLLYACGVVGLMLAIKLTLYKAILNGVVPFIGIDIVKTILAAILASEVRF